MRFLIAVLLCAAGALPAAAQGVLYDCTVRQTSGASGWVSSRMALIVDATGGGQVVDNLTLTYFDGARPARLVRRGAELRFQWSISNAQDRTGNQIPTMSYTARLDTGDGSVRVRVKPAGYPQSMNGRGTCTTRRNMGVRELNRLLRG